MDSLEAVALDFLYTRKRKNSEAFRRQCRIINVMD